MVTQTSRDFTRLWSYQAQLQTQSESGLCYPRPQVSWGGLHRIRRLAGGNRPYFRLNLRACDDGGTVAGRSSRSDGVTKLQT